MFSLGLLKPLAKPFLILCAATAIFFGGALWKEAAMNSHMAEQAKIQVEELKKEMAREALRSSESSFKVSQEIERTNKEQVRIRDSVISRLQSQLNEAAQPTENFDVNKPQECPVSASDFRFDVGTVRMLNEARSGSVPSIDSSTGSDAASRAPSTVGIVALTEADLEVVRRYHELAKRHNALIDYIELKQKQQSK